MTDPPTTSSKGKKNLSAMWHMILEMWHMTGGGGWTFSQNVRSQALTVWEWRCFEDLEENGHLLN